MAWRQKLVANASRRLRAESYEGLTLRLPQPGNHEWSQAGVKRIVSHVGGKRIALSYVSGKTGLAVERAVLSIDGRANENYVID